ncbi:hypothetical protein WDH52_22715 [Streptomyces sp. TRM70308]|uniref:hypothetical protein n=1 Tax=Streptomyces sp. TRM70308 TaxID=3131932 RepID=UPI003CFD5E84
MKHQRRARIWAGCCVVAIAVFGWYASQTVRPDCTFGYTAFSGRDGQPRAENGETVTWEDLEERIYQDMVASGRCEPPAARWRQWVS